MFAPDFSDVIISMSGDVSNPIFYINLMAFSKGDQGICVMY